MTFEAIVEDVAVIGCLWVNRATKSPLKYSTFPEYDFRSVEPIDQSESEKNRQVCRSTYGTIVYFISPQARGVKGLMPLDSQKPGQ